LESTTKCQIFSQQALKSYHFLQRNRPFSGSMKNAIADFRSEVSTRKVKG
jgi:hypothetical protein